MENQDVELIFLKLEKAVDQDDRSLIIDYCNELSFYGNELDNNIKFALYYALALAHLREEHYLLSYKAIEQSIRIENSEQGRSIMNIVKQKIVENTHVR